MRNGPGRTRLPLSSLAIPAIVTAFVLAVGASSRGATEEVALAFAVGTSLNAIAIWREVDARRFDEPLVYGLCYLLLAYPFRFAAVRLSWFNAREDYPGLMFRDDLVLEALVGFGLGVLALVAGYGDTRPRSVKEVPAEWIVEREQMKAHLLVAVGLLAVGASSWTLEYATGRYSTFVGAGANWTPEMNVFFAHAGNYGWIGVILTALCATRQIEWAERPMLLTSVATTLAGLAVGATVVLQASKTWMIAPVVWILMASQLSGRRVRLLVALSATTAALAAAFLIVPLARKSQLENYGAGQVSFERSVESFREAVTEMPESERHDGGVMEALIGRFGGMDNALMARRLAEIGSEPLWFRELVLVPFALLPRFLVPDKPSYDVATWYSREVAGMTSGGSAAPHPIAEGFLNAGFLGVVALCAGWGGLLRGLVLLERRFGGEGPGAPLVTAVYVFWSFTALGFGAWIIATVIGLMHAAALTSPLLWLAWRMGRRERDKARFPQ